MKQYKRYFYTVFLIAIMAVLSPFVWKKIWSSNVPAQAEAALQSEITTEAIPAVTLPLETQAVISAAESAQSGVPETQSPATETIQTVAPPSETETAIPTTEPIPSTDAGTQPLPIETISPTEPPAAALSFVQGDANYFSDALFIGDSRTVGISEYGNLKNADYFASVGMNVYNLRKDEVSVPSVGKVNLDTLLSVKSYGKIYIMLGINELGYDFNTTVNQYAEIIAYLREKQPGALIFIEANLHVTKKRSEQDAVFNNNAINRFNNAIAQMADNHSIFYIDINELFDDESGSLRQDYSGDNTHVFGKYYAQWCGWLCTKTIQ